MYPNEFISNLFSTNKNFEDYARIEKDNKREKNLVRNIELNRCSIKFSGGQEREKFGEPLSRFNFVDRGKEVARLLADSFQDSTGYRGHFVGRFRQKLNLQFIARPVQLSARLFGRFTAQPFPPWGIIHLERATFLPTKINAPSFRLKLIISDYYVKETKKRTCSVRFRWLEVKKES